MDSNETTPCVSPSPSMMSGSSSSSGWSMGSYGLNSSSSSSASIISSAYSSASDPADFIRSTRQMERIMMSSPEHINVPEKKRSSPNKPSPSPSPSASPKKPIAEKTTKKRRKMIRISTPRKSHRGANAITSAAAIPLRAGQKLRLPNQQPSVKSWELFLRHPSHFKYVAPVDYFPHAPLSDVWSDFALIGRKIEIPNGFNDCDRPTMWIATVLTFCGYKCLVEYERFGLKPKHVAWISYCSYVPKPFGYADSNKIPLSPDVDVWNACSDYIARARRTLVGYETIDADHGEFVEEQVRICQKFQMGEMLEVLDRSNISRMRLATVAGIIGDRIHVIYNIEPAPNDQGFWFSCNSESVKPLGWSATIGQEIYDSTCIFPELPPSYFPTYPEELVLRVGQSFEARHPMRPHLIAAAKVHKVLKYGYFVASFCTTQMEKRRPTLYTFHVTSPLIFPCGYCDKMDIHLAPTYRSSESKNVKHKTKVPDPPLDPAPFHLIPKRPPHKFIKGLKLETVDILAPIFMYPVTVTRVVDHLLRLHYDGWSRADESCYVWTSADSPDIYPVGYAELVGHSFESDPQNPLPCDVPTEPESEPESE